jgi:hypothetical protein
VKLNFRQTEQYGLLTYYVRNGAGCGRLMPYGSATFPLPRAELAINVCRGKQKKLITSRTVSETKYL